AVTGFAQLSVAAEFISVDVAAKADICLHEGLQRLAALVRNHLGHNLAAALQSADNDRLGSAAAIVSALLDAAHQGFVNFNAGAGAADLTVTVNVSHVL